MSPQQKRIVYYDPPVRSAPRPEIGLIAAVVPVLFILLVYGVVTSSSDELGQTATTKKSNKPTSISIADMKPCEMSYSPRIRLNTQERLEACIKAKKYAKQRILQRFGKKTKQLECLDKLWTHESLWSPWAENASSKAAGIPQAIRRIHGHVFDMGDWRKQVDWGLGYIKKRYGTPCKAWAFWQRTDPRPHPDNWY